MGRLISIIESVQLPVGREVVWDLLMAELAGAGTWWGVAKTLDKNPGTVGSRVRWTVTPNVISNSGSRFQLEATTVEAVRPTRLAMSLRGDLEGKGIFRLRETREGTRLSLEFSAECRGWLGALSRVVDLPAGCSRSVRGAFTRLRGKFSQVSVRGSAVLEFPLCGTTPAARTTKHLRTVYGDILRVWFWRQIDEPPARATAVLAHGWGSSSRAFDETVEKLLGQGMDVVTLDWPGHGASVLHPAGRLSLERLDAGLREVLDLIEVRPVILVGHSGGALVGTIAVAKNSTIDGFVILSAALRYPGTSVAEVVIKGSRVLDIILNSPVLSEVVLSRTMGPSTPTATRVLTSSRLRAVAPAVRRAYFKASRKVDLTEFARRVSVPALVMIGSEDMALPIHAARAAALTFPRGSFRLLAGRGHALPEEASEEVVRAVLELVQGVERPGSSRVRR